VSWHHSSHGLPIYHSALIFPSTLKHGRFTVWCCVTLCQRYFTLVPWERDATQPQQDWSNSVQNSRTAEKNCQGCIQLYSQAARSYTWRRPVSRSASHRYRSRMQLPHESCQSHPSAHQPLLRQDGRSSCDVTVGLLQRSAVQNFRSKHGTPAGLT